MKRVLLNATTIRRGGGLQAVVNFIRMARAGDQVRDWVFAVSKDVAEQLRAEGIELQNAREFVTSPARSRQARRELRNFEREVAPGLVFTFFGPAYVRFRAFHVCGVANGWVTHPNRYAYKALGFANSLVSRFRRLYRARWFSTADAWVVEAEIAKQGLIALLRCPAERIDVVPNVCGDRYRSLGAIRRCTPKSDQIRIFVFSAYYRHKNIELVTDVAAVLRKKRPALTFEFVLTLPEESAEFLKICRMAHERGLGAHLLTLGVVALKDGPDAYASCDISFLPTLLETSSAVFPESMAMGLPVVTTRLDFNTAVCRNAAVYFDPMNAESAADALLNLIEDHALWERCVARGKELVEGMGDQVSKYHAYERCITKYLSRA